MKREAAWGRFEIAGPRHEYREALLCAWVERFVPAGGTILDAGAGGGSLAVKLARRGYRVIAVEPAPEFPARTSERATREGVAGRIRMMRGDVTALPLANASVDAVVSGEVLEHVDDEAAVVEFRRVMRPGGACVVSVPAHPALWDLTDEWAGHRRRYSRDRLIELFAAGGLSVERVRAWGFPTVLLYHRLLVLPLARRRGGDLSGLSGSRGVSSWSGRLASRLLSAVFRVDGLFGVLPVGWGWLLAARLSRSSPM